MNKKALRERAAAEARDKAKAKQPGSVIVTFKVPCQSVPWWRLGPHEDDFKMVYPNSGVNVQGEVIQVVTNTPAGPINRLFHWRDVDAIVAIPAISGPTAETDKE